MNKHCELILVHGEVGSGKTTSLMNLARDFQLRGLTFTGVISIAIFKKGAKLGYDAVLLPSFEQFELCRAKNETGYPRWNFNKQAFERGNDYIKQKLPSSAVVLIDEVGELEINKEGWYSSIEEALKLSIPLIYLSGKKKKLTVFRDQTLSSYSQYQIKEMNI